MSARGIGNLVSHDARPLKRHYGSRTGEVTVMDGLNRAAAFKTAIALTVIAGIESAFILLYPRVWLGHAFRNAANVSPAAWLTAGLVTFAYVAYSVRGLPSLAPLLVKLAPFKLLAFVIAVPSSILEEVFFRSGIMNGLAAQHQALAVQIIASAALFGAAHGFWGFRGGLSALAGAVVSTTLLGFGLAVLFVVAGRIVFACVVAHFLINVIIEPWLMYVFVARAQAGRSARAAA